MKVVKKSLTFCLGRRVIVLISIFLLSVALYFVKPESLSPSVTIIDKNFSSYVWGIKHLDIHAVLAENNIGYNFTLFDAQKVVYRDKQELAELHSATGLDIKELVALRPERILLHELIVQAVTKIRFDNPDEMRTFVKNNFAKLIQYSETKRILTKVNKYRADLQKIPFTNGAETDILIKEDYLPGEFINSYTVQDAMHALSVDRKYRNYADFKINQFITEFLNGYLKTNPKHAIELNENSKPYTVMLAGGPASGKSTYGYAVKHKFEQNNIDWRNVVKINSDSYKKLLVDFDPIKYDVYYSQLVQPETQMISNYRLKQRIGEYIAKKKIQYVFWDQVLIDPVRVSWGLKHDGRVDIFLVNADVKTAINRAYHRGQHTGRYESTKLILELHKQVVKQLPKVITSFAGKKMNLTLLDNSRFSNPGNQPNDESITKVVKIDNMHQSVYLYDTEKLQNFINKLNINSNTNNMNELYAVLGDTSVDDYLDLFYKKGYKVFV